VGKQLGVASVLEGTVRKDGSSVRVAVRLVSAEDGRVLWASASYDRALADIFTLQDEIARSVAAGLRVKLNGEGEQRLARRFTGDVEAYQLYLIGKHHLSKRTEDGFKRGIEYFQQAIAKDPNYALAYAGLADCHALLSPYGKRAPKEGHLKAKAAAAKALEIDDQLAEAHTSLANITWLYEWDWPGAEKGFKRAIELNPNYPTSHQWYSAYLSAMGRHEEAIQEARRALELDPLSLPIIRDLARCFYHARQFDEAITQYLKTIELEPNYYRLNSWLDMAYEQKGLYDRAFEVRLKAMTVLGFNPETIEARKKAYAERGWKGYWRKELELTEEWALQSRGYVSPYGMARIFARLGEKDRVLGWLEKAYTERSDHLVLLKVDPLFDDLRSDPRFIDLLRRVGFTSLPGYKGDRSHRALQIQNRGR
jgi:tetratricopeptide (TPR) repeat protein